MPTKTEWVEPELFVAHKDVRVFHTYKDDDFDNGPSDYWFTLSNESDEPKHHFDVRELPTHIAPVQPPYVHQGGTNAEWEQHWKDRDRAVRQAIIEAIESGIITQEGIKS